MIRGLGVWQLGDELADGTFTVSHHQRRLLQNYRSALRAPAPSLRNLAENEVLIVFIRSKAMFSERWVMGKEGTAHSQTERRILLLDEKRATNDGWIRTRCRCLHAS